MQKKVMKLAVKMARKFEGDWIARMKMALKVAWAIIKKGVNKMAELKTSTGSKNHKTWVAKITGTHPKFKFNREFVNEFEEDGLGRTYDLADGFYDVCDAGERKYVKVEGGEIEKTNADDIAAAL